MPHRQPNPNRPAHSGIGDHLPLNTPLPVDFQVPLIAVGIGVGIDYSIYLMDRIRSEFYDGQDLHEAIKSALETTGKAIGFTAAVLICGVMMWVFVSDLKFQADAAMLLIVMLALNAMASVFLVPAWLRKFTPEFITRQAQQEAHK